MCGANPACLLFSIPLLIDQAEVEGLGDIYVEISMTKLAQLNNLLVQLTSNLYFNYYIIY